MKKGFTLIELLVVIAIIGILSAIVLASLNKARQRSRVASLKAEVVQVKNQAEIFYAKHNSYIDPSGNTACDTMTTLRDKVAELVGNQSFPFGMCVITTSGNDYAIEVSTGNNTYWCNDSKGYIGESRPENPTPQGAFTNYHWSPLRICNGINACGGHSRTICSPL